MFAEFEYVIPSDLSEACNFLEDHGPETKIVAGGTDLVLSLRRGEMKPRFLLDISGLKELCQIENAGDQVVNKDLNQIEVPFAVSYIFDGLIVYGEMGDWWVIVNEYIKNILGKITMEEVEAL